MHEVTDVGLRVLGWSALTVRRALSAASLPLITTGALVVPTPGTAFAAPERDRIDAGANHTCSVVAGAVQCWGRDVAGGGDGGSGRRTTAAPVDPGAMAGLRITRISGGGAHTCALSSVGRAYCWGAGSDGRLGDGDAVRRARPVAVDTGGALSGVRLTRISAGWLHTCALSSTGRAFCWGNGGSGRLGDGATVTRTSPAPVRLAGVRLAGISAGRSHTCAVSSAGAAYCWGAGGSGQLGDGRSVRASVPVPVDTSGALSGARITQVAAGANHTCALSSAGAVFCWGRNTSGQLGHRGLDSSSVPVDAGALSGVRVTQIAAGANHTCALSSAGAIYCWGANAQGQLGSGGSAHRSGPVAVDVGPALSGGRPQHLTAGGNHTCAASATVAYCWGRNSSGQLGDGSTTDSRRPVRVDLRPAPEPPTAVTATPGDGRAKVSWSAPASTVGRYRVTASPGAGTCTSSTTGCAVTGLANGTAYTFTVVANGPDGTSPASAPSDAVTPFTPPGAPTGVAATAGDGQVTVSWSAPADGGTGGVAGYVVRVMPGGATCRTTTTRCPVRGLTNGTPYTFTVVARSAYGRSAPSAESSPATPSTPTPTPSAPSATPTPTPTPSALPTPPPRAVPTALPTPPPRAVPTAQPTPPPRAIPTAQPTPPPRAIPTAQPPTRPAEAPTGPVEAPTGPVEAPTGPAEATGRPAEAPRAADEAPASPDRQPPLTTDEYDAAPLLPGSAPGLPPDSATPPDVPSQEPPADLVLGDTAAAGAARPAVEPAKVAIVVLGMALLVVGGTVAMAYRGRRRGY